MILVNDHGQIIARFLAYSNISLLKSILTSLQASMLRYFKTTTHGLNGVDLEFTIVAKNKFQMWNFEIVWGSQSFWQLETATEGRRQNKRSHAAEHLKHFINNTTKNNTTKKVWRPIFRRLGQWRHLGLGLGPGPVAVALGSNWLPD